MNKLKQFFSKTYPTELQWGSFRIQVLKERKQNLLSLKTSVYSGDVSHYIPPSVRRSICQPPPFYPTLPYTSLTIDEENFQIYLHHKTDNRFSSPEDTLELVEKFGRLAEEWRAYLDRLDQGDLLPAYVPRF